MSDTAPTNEPDSSERAFWTQRWHRGKVPWDLGTVPPDLLSFLERTTTPTRVLIPGCGSGYEVRAFHDRGHDVTAIDFSATAVAHAKELLGPLGEKVFRGDFFEHDFGEQRFGLIYERGFLCSLPTTKWPDYAARMASLLRPGGKLAGLFLYGQEPEPPPYPLTPQTAAELFGQSFRLLRDETVVAKTVAVYQGMEHWEEWERTGA
jgi:SAM-dependent methyltransferase